jgi:N-acetylmuramoyl-L-alanine amidase
MPRAACIIGALIIAGLVAGCQSPQPHEPEPAADPQVSVDTLLPAPPDFALQRIGTDQWPIPPYARYLEGVRICLDPGHGGDAHKRGYKRGPSGVREAEMNLRVAQYLRDFLEAAGAEVKLTREDDTASSLAERAAVANEWGADLFLSLHHNAMSKRPKVNRTTVWYHRDVDFRPANLDLARYVCYGLYDSIALPQIAGIPLHSDQLMYESGFGILRNAKVTAALTESSFFTNPDEEQRLRDPEYNLLEAYGLFLGFAKYTNAGLPKAHLVEPADGIVPAGPDQALVFELDDGLRARKSWGADRQMILSDSLAVRVDGEPVPFTFVNKGYRLTVELPADLAPGDHAVEVQYHNMYKNAVLNPHFTVTVAD